MLNEELINVESYFENKNEILIKVFDFKGLYENIKAIEDNGYKLENNQGNIYIFNGKKKVKLEVLKNILLNIPVQMPDYKNSMVNIVSSIAKYYHKESKYESMEILDNELSKGYKHVIFMILDGLGPYIINQVLDDSAFLKKYLVKTISAVFPPTTACAIPASASGLLACDTGWLGWENHFDELDKDLVMFTGVDYYSGEPTGIDVRKKYLPYEDYFKDFDTFVSDLEPSFKTGGFDTFKELLDKLLKITNEQDSSFTYVYWDEPDGTLHQDGVCGDNTKVVIKQLNDNLERIKDKLGKDTLLIITADHGHQDVYPINFNEFLDLKKMLICNPSNEGRALCFRVKEECNALFKATFNKYFSSIYDLYTKDEFINKGFLGRSNDIHPRLLSFLGDYIAIAKSNVYFIYNNASFVFKSAHAGYTKNEMETPLILYSNK